MSDPQGQTRIGCDRGASRARGLRASDFFVFAFTCQAREHGCQARQRVQDPSSQWSGTAVQGAMELALPQGCQDRSPMMSSRESVPGTSTPVYDSALRGAARPSPTRVLAQVIGGLEHA